MANSDLIKTVNALLSPGKGILAADESLPTVGKRFAALGIESSEENRRTWRELLLTTTDLGEYISGVILFDETMRQMLGGFQAPELLRRQEIIAGVKVDMGTTDLAAFPGEKSTQGLDGLRERLAAYRELGARFTKWRAVIIIGEGLPSRTSLQANAETLAQFAALSQEAGLVPLVEPEVLMEGNHSIERCEEVLQVTLQAVFAALQEHRVFLEGMVLKTGMVLPGKNSHQKADLNVVAEATLRCLRRSVPAAVPGIAFLSGGQSEMEATERLNALCRTTQLPWKLSFSYGRALQDGAMKAWQGSSTNRGAAQDALRHRARCNAVATLGRFSSRTEQPAVGSIA